MRTVEISTELDGTGPTIANVQPTGTMLASNVPTATSTDPTDGIVQPTSKFLRRGSKKPLRHQ
jgi:hypothetical protein